MNIISHLTQLTRRALFSTPTIASLAVASSVLALTQTVRLHKLSENSVTAASQVEQSMERMHSMGYEAGYQSAIVDAYLQNPKYLIEENSEGRPVMWKKVDLDETNSALLSSATAE